MEAHEPGHRDGADGGRPLTRRELRARAAGVQTPPAWPYPADLHSGLDVPAPAGEAMDELPDDVHGDAGPGVAGAGTDADAPPDGDSWAVTVGWAVHHELPPTLPPEPDESDDDVRWDPVLPEGAPDGVRVDELHPAETPAQAAWATQWAPQTWAPEPPAAETRAGRRRAIAAAADQPGARGEGADGGSGGVGGPGDAGDADDAGHVADGADGADVVPGAYDDDIAEAEADADADAEAFDDSDLDLGEAQPRRVSVLGGQPGSRSPIFHVGEGFGGVAPIGAAARVPFPVPAEQPAASALAGPEAPEAVWEAPVPPAPSAVPPVPVSASTGLPTLDDLLATRRPAPSGPAEIGWRGVVRRITAGVIALPPGVAEREDREAVATVQRSLDGPRTVVVINPKGGAHKTTASLLIAATFGRHRGGYTLAWDNNETRGTLGWRAHHSHHRNTAVDLLDDLDRFSDSGSSRVGDLDNYVRSQGSAQFDVLASDEDAASAASIDDFAFRALHRTLERFYRVLVIDTGNNMRASNWQAAIEAADQVVVVSTMREDTAQSAAWALDALRATGHEAVVRKAVTVLSQPAPKRDAELAARLHDHFSRLTRAVYEVPYEPTLVPGGPIDYDALSDASRRAWLHVTAAVSEGL